MSPGATPPAPGGVHEMYPPFRRLLVADFHGLMSQAFLVALLIALTGLLGLARQWVAATFTAMEQEIEITAVLPAEADGEALSSLREALAARREVNDLAAFSAETARARLQAAGVDVDTLDPFALQRQPSGLTFRWSGLIADPGAWSGQAERLTGTHGATFHWDQRRALRHHLDAARADSYLRGLRGWATLGMLTGLLIAAVVRRPPSLGVTLRRGEMAQALFVRGGVAATLGWFLAGGVLKLASGWPPLVDWTGLWIGLLWVVPVAALFAPLGVLRIWDECEP